jgi:hypothetical protein
MIFILRPQITRLAPLNLVLGALAIAAVALWRFGANFSALCMTITP